MSVSSYAHSLIGVKIPCPYKTGKVQDCSHAPFEMDKFCSECGAGWVDKDLPVCSFDPRQMLEEGTEEWEGFNVVTGGCYDNPTYYIGDYVGRAHEYSEDHGGRVILPAHLDVHNVKIRLQEKLEPAGLWDESKFGLWSVLFTSY